MRRSLQIVWQDTSPLFHFVGHSHAVPQKFWREIVRCLYARISTVQWVDEFEPNTESFVTETLETRQVNNDVNDDNVLNEKNYENTTCLEHCESNYLSKSKELIEEFPKSNQMERKCEEVIFCEETEQSIENSAQLETEKKYKFATIFHEPNTETGISPFPRMLENNLESHPLNRYKLEHLSVTGENPRQPVTEFIESRHQTYIPLHVKKQRKVFQVITLPWHKSSFDRNENAAADDDDENINAIYDSCCQTTSDNVHYDLHTDCNNPHDVNQEAENEKTKCTTMQKYDKNNKHSDKNGANDDGDDDDDIVVTLPSTLMTSKNNNRGEISSKKRAPNCDVHNDKGDDRELYSHPSSRGVSEEICNLVTDAFTAQREAAITERRRVLYEITHPIPSHYTYKNKLVPPPPLSFGVITDLAKEMGNKLMLGQSYRLVNKAGVRVNEDVHEASPLTISSTSNLIEVDVGNASGRAQGSNNYLAKLKVRRNDSRETNAFRDHRYFFEINDLYQEIVLVGKANAGKSSLLNALLGQHVAKTSSTPNSTKAINFYQSVSPEQLRLFHEREHRNLVKLPGKGLQLTFVDVPGFGIHGMSDKWREAIITLTDSYFGVRRSINTVLFCIDCEHGLTKSDAKYFEWLENVHGMFFVVLTKCDSVPHSRICSVMRQVYVLITEKRRKYRKVYPFIIPTSAKDGTNIEMLRGLIAETSGFIPADRLRKTLQEMQRANEDKALEKERDRLLHAQMHSKEEARKYFAQYANTSEEHVNACEKLQYTKNKRETMCLPQNLHLPLPRDARSSAKGSTCEYSTHSTDTQSQQNVPPNLSTTPTFLTKSSSFSLREQKCTESPLQWQQEEQQEQQQHNNWSYANKIKVNTGVENVKTMESVLNYTNHMGQHGLLERDRNEIELNEHHSNDLFDIQSRSVSAECNQPLDNVHNTAKANRSEAKNTVDKQSVFDYDTPFNLRYCNNCKTDNTKMPEVSDKVFANKLESRTTVMNTNVCEYRKEQERGTGNANAKFNALQSDAHFLENTNRSFTSPTSSRIIGLVQADEKWAKSTPDLCTSRNVMSDNGKVSKFVETFTAFSNHLPPHVSKRCQKELTVAGNTQNASGKHGNTLSTVAKATRTVLNKQHGLYVQDNDGQLQASKAGRFVGPKLPSLNSPVETRLAIRRSEYLRELLCKENPEAPWNALSSLTRKMEREKEEDKLNMTMRRKERVAYKRNAGSVIESFDKFEGEVTMKTYMNERRQVKTLRSQQQLHLNATSRINYTSMPAGLLKKYNQRDNFHPTPHVIGRQNDESHQQV